MKYNRLYENVMRNVQVQSLNESYSLEDMLAYWDDELASGDVDEASIALEIERYKRQLYRNDASQDDIRAIDKFMRTRLGSNLDYNRRQTIGYNTQDRMMQQGDESSSRIPEVDVVGNRLCQARRESGISENCYSMFENVCDDEEYDDLDGDYDEFPNYQDDYSSKVQVQQKNVNLVEPLYWKELLTQVRTALVGTFGDMVKDVSLSVYKGQTSFDYIDAMSSFNSIKKWLHKYANSKYLTFEIHIVDVIGRNTHRNSVAKVLCDMTRSYDGLQFNGSLQSIYDYLYIILRTLQDL